jgi:hypothetical protein
MGCLWHTHSFILYPHAPAATISQLLIAKLTSYPNSFTLAPTYTFITASSQIPHGLHTISHIIIASSPSAAPGTVPFLVTPLLSVSTLIPFFAS